MGALLMGSCACCAPPKGQARLVGGAHVLVGEHLALQPPHHHLRAVVQHTIVVHGQLPRLRVHQAPAQTDHVFRVWGPVLGASPHLCLCRGCM